MCAKYARAYPARAHPMRAYPMRAQPMRAYPMCDNPVRAYAHLPHARLPAPTWSPIRQIEHLNKGIKHVTVGTSLSVSQV